MTQNVEIRPARTTDAGRLLEIYTPYVLHTTITFEYEVPTICEFSNRITHILEKYPYLVATLNNNIIGYAYADAFKARKAYEWSVETSIYIDSNFHNLGIGSLLYKELELILQKQNVCNLCACISYPNPDSICFHEKMGFSQVAHFHNSGYKFHSWVDMIWMEKSIGNHLPNPKPFIPIKEVL